MLSDYGPNSHALTESSIPTGGTIGKNYLVASGEVKYLYTFRAHFLDVKTVYQKDKEQYDTNSIRVQYYRMLSPACKR